MTKNSYLKMDIVGYHNFIDHFFNHIKNNLIFALVKTDVLLTIFFHNIKKFFFLLNNVMKKFISKMKNKKAKAKHYYQANKENLQKRSRQYYTELS